MRISGITGFAVALGWLGAGELEAQLQLQPFVDVAPAARIDIWTSKSYVYAAVGWGDYDRDGWLDLYMGISGANGRLIGRRYSRSENRRWNRLYHNEGNGTFQEATVTAGVLNPGDVFDVAWGDYDNDGWVDLYCSNADTTGLLFHNEGNGTFRDVTVMAAVWDATQGGAGTSWVDYDQDGWLDLYVAKTSIMKGAGVSRLYRNRRDGTFEEVAGKVGVARGGFGVAWADYDRDGWEDLVVSDAVRSQQGRRTVWAYHNQGDGTFQEAGEAIGLVPSVRTGTGTALFRNAALYGVTWGDYDNDGWLDLAIATLDGLSHEVYRNQGDGTFQYVQGIGIQNQGGLDPTWMDIDNDGWLDLFVGGEGVNRLYVNRGNGAFIEMARLLGVENPEIPPFQKGNNTESAAWGDYDHDGFLDGYLANGDRPNQLYRNSGNGNHWLVVQLVGVRSNRSAIGAKVWVVVGQHRQLRDISGGSGGGSHTLAGAAFGVGAATQIDSMMVEWPSGRRDTRTDLAVDQAIEVVEEQAPAVRVLYGTGAWQLDRPLAQPSIFPQGRLASVHLTIRVIPPTPGQRPAQVTADLRAIGGARAVALRDDGQLGDSRAGDGSWSRSQRVAPTVPAGEYGLPVTVRDARGQPQGSARRIRLSVWPQNRAIYTDGLAAGWQVVAQGTATSDVAATGHVYQGRAAHRLRLPDSKATVQYRAVDPLGMSVWEAQAVEFWVWGATVEAVNGLVVTNYPLSSFGVRPVARQWLRVQIPIQRVIEKGQGLTDRMSELVFQRVADWVLPPEQRVVEVWIDEVRVVAAPLPGQQRPVVEELQAETKGEILLPNVPNPFNAETVLHYQVGRAGGQQVVLRVHNLAGQVVRTLVQEEQRPGGYTVKWDGRDGLGREVASGTYLARLEVGSVTQTRKLLLVR